MLKVAVLDDYQNAFQQIVEVDKYKDKFNFQVFNEPFSDEKEAAENAEIDAAAEAAALEARRKLAAELGLELAS